MSIQDFLQEHDDERKRKQSADKERREKETEARAKFTAEANEQYKTIVEPFLQNLQEQFTKLKWGFSLRQDVVTMSYIDGIQRSFTVQHGNKMLQTDIVAHPATLKYELAFRTQAHGSGEKSQYLEMLTEELLNSSIESKLREVFKK